VGVGWGLKSADAAAPEFAAVAGDGADHGADKGADNGALRTPLLVVDVEASGASNSWRDLGGPAARHLLDQRPMTNDRRPTTARFPRATNLLCESRRQPGRTTPAESAVTVTEENALDTYSYFCKYRIMTSSTAKEAAERVAKYADMFSAMGTEARLRIMQLLLSAHPGGLVVGEIQEELEIPNSTLSHHLDKLKAEGLVQVQRESTFLRYTASTDALEELLRFLYAECCTRNKAVKPEQIVQLCR